MNSVIAIWATAIATVDALARIGVILAGAATPGPARGAAGQVADDGGAMAAGTASGPGQLHAGAAGRTPAGVAAR
jgi:hypothetical protein